MSSRFDWAATVLSLTFLGGVFLDGWAHTHGRVDETFFTPWHAVLYSGFFAMTGLLLGRAAWGRVSGLPFRRWLPDGYTLSLAGVGLWFIGGPFDLAWHTVFGFEANVEALLSPAHTLLAVGVGLMTTGPVRAALRRPAGRWRDELPMVLSLTCVVLNVTFFTQIAHPLSNLWAAGYPRSASITELGLVGMLLTAVILVAPLLLMLRLDRLPAGGVTLVVGVDCFAMGFLFDQGAYPLAPMAAMVAAAVVADGVRAILRPSPTRPAAFRWFALLLPVLLYAAYFAALAATHGLGYTVHLWVGVIVFAGVLGWLLSYVALPPRLPDGPTAAADTPPRAAAKRVDPHEVFATGTR